MREGNRIPILIHLAPVSKLVVAIVAGAFLLPATSTAATAPASWGPPPKKCQATSEFPGGCHGYRDGDTYYLGREETDDLLTISPRVVRVGQTVTMTVRGGMQGAPWQIAAGLRMLPSTCTNSSYDEDDTCTFRAVAPTEGWEIYSINPRYLGGFGQPDPYNYWEEDYYGVLPASGPAKIKGRVVDERGHGIPDLRITANGPDSFAARTSFTGYYNIRVPESDVGDYVVTPRGGDATFEPARKKFELTPGATKEANFTQETCPVANRAPRRADRVTAILSGLYKWKAGEQPGSTATDIEAYVKCSDATIHVQDRIDFSSGDCSDDWFRHFGKLWHSQALTGTSFRITFGARYAESERGGNFSDYERRDGGDWGAHTQVVGEFTGNRVVQVRWKRWANGPDATCQNAGPAGRPRWSELHLVDRDPSPFRD